RVPEVNALLNVVGVSSWAGPIILNTNLTVAGGNMTLSAAISGAGGLRFLFNDRAQLAGSEANTYTGDTWADGGLLELNKASGVTAFRGRLIVNAGSGAPDEVRWLQDFQCIGADVTLFPGALVNLNNRRDEFGPVTFNAGTIATGTGEIGIYGLVTVNPSIDSAFITGRLGLPGGIREYRVSDGSPFPDLRIDATIVGPGGLRKTGIGQMWLAAANTYGGLTIVAEGALSVLDPNGLGAPATGTTVNEGGTLEVNFIGSMPEPLAIRGAGLAGQGSLGVFGNVTLRTPFPSIYAAIDLTTHAAIGVAPDSQLTVDGTVSGIGNLTKAGPGTLWFGGNDHNTYSGETFINEGRFIMGKPSGATAVPGPLNIGSPAGLSALAGNVASYQVIGNIFVNRGGLLNLNGQAENVDHLWLSEGGDVQTTTGVLFLKSGGSIQVVPGAVGDPATISGNLDMDAGAHVINVGASTALSGPNLEITALISSSVGAITLQKNGPGTLRFAANNTYSGTTIVNEGVLRVDGWQQQGAVRVNAAGTLQGVGVVGNITFSGNGGVVAPGASPGVLGCNSFSFGSSGGGILEIELNGASPGSGHDQLTVGGIGQIDLSGITLRAKPGFIAATNQQFVIINNFGNPAVQGAFNGLPENASLTLGDQLFRISYIGGDGNDVMLTKIGDVFRPRLWIERIAPASVRLLWPTNDLVFTLQFTTNSSGTNFTGWSVVPEAPVLSGTNRVVTNSSSGAHKLYRLLKP
ncbi:MAG TPA: autotransporter-associated beta strand repeat-containing protein, partial [Candidatus Limnocylindria bacterium]|nr:autotransporter-associated beta strand repeat-containing protein [Candidatus Limnocylindria bacterium]